LDSGRRRASVRTGVLATSLNPTLLATWTVVVTSLHGQDWIRGGLAQGLSFGLGVALGSFGWFVLMMIAVRRLETKDIARYRPQIMRAVGVILSGAGVVLLLRTLFAN
jgi:threonine/homoserine/homoserine lactone efflux protein